MAVRNGLMDRVRALLRTYSEGLTTPQLAAALGVQSSSLVKGLRQAHLKGTLGRSGQQGQYVWHYTDWAEQRAAAEQARRAAKEAALRALEVKRKEQARRREEERQQRKNVAAPGLAEHKQVTATAFQPPVVRSRGPAHMPGDPVITESTRIVRAPTPQDKRFAPDRHVRVVDSRECRPWALEVGR